MKVLIRNLLKKKPYLELIVAVLTVPVLVTLIIVNYGNIQNKDKSSADTNQRPIVIEKDNNLSAQNTPLPSVVPSPDVCREKVGPVNIASPKEGAIISENPVNFIIRYEDESYCSVVWSYRINGSVWSEYSSNSPTVYNLPPGEVKFELRVQSTVSDDQDLLERNFTYEGQLVSSSPTPSTEN